MSSVSYRNFTGTAAENYQRYFVPAIGTPIAATLLSAAELQPGERVVDVACGTGVIARLAAAQVGPTGSVTGIDLAPDMIDVAKRHPNPGVNIDWQEADAGELPLDDGACDVALCQMGLMFMADPVAALVEMRRILAPGGRIAINTPGRIQPPFEHLEAALAEHLDPAVGHFVSAVFSLHDPDAVATLLRDAGFEDVEVTETTGTLDLPGPAEFLWQYINLTPMAPLVESAPAEAKQALEQQVVEAWQPFVVDGRTPVEQPFVVATARR